MDADAALEREKDFWNARYDTFGAEPQPYSEETFRDAITPSYEPSGSPGGLVHRRALDIVLAEGIAGRRVLDYCCGRGKWSMHLAALGATVSGFDASQSAIEHARERAAFNGLEARFDVADARDLPYEDGAFDVVLGISALEHVIKYEGSGPETRRVLRDGGLAVFTENLGQNPVINLARRVTMRGEEDAGDVLLTDRIVRDWAASFSDVTIEGYSILFMLKRLLRGRRPLSRTVLRACHSVDEALFRVAPGLRRYGGECVVTLRA